MSPGMRAMQPPINLDLPAPSTGTYRAVLPLLWPQDRFDLRLRVVLAFVAMIAAIVWSPMLGRFESIFQGINAMICYIAPPITTVFLWGVLWKGASARAAQVTLYAGSALGLCVFLLDWFKESSGWDVPFMMAAFYLFVACSILLAVLSQVWKREATPESDRLVWDNPLSTLRADETTWRGIGDFRLVSAVLFLTMVGLYWVFA